MKRGIRFAILACVLAVITISITGCSQDYYNNREKKKIREKYAGTYAYEWSIMKMYGEGHGDGVDRDWELILEADGSGIFRQSDMELHIEWEVDPDEEENFYMKTTRSLSKKEYFGTIDETSLHFYDSKYHDKYTTEYQFTKVKDAK